MITLSDDIRIHRPGDEAYDEARCGWNLAADVRPFAVARPRTVAEAIGVVRYAAEHSLRVVVMNTGHGALTLAGVDLSETLLLRTDAMAEVTVDPIARTGRVTGGAQVNDLLTAAAAHGLTFAHGSAGDVGVAGLVLGGGLSFYGRKHGFTCDALRSADVIVGTGTLVRASATENADLFWALRGGATNVGVVVALELELLPYADVVAGMLIWPAEEGERVTRAWRDWCGTAPESVTTSLRLISFPPLDELPPFLSGQRLLIIDGAIVGDDAHAVELLAPLRALGPSCDTFARVPAIELVTVHLDPPNPAPAVGDHALLGELDDAAIATFVREWSETGLFNVELRQLGGRLNAERDSALRLSPQAAYAFHSIAMAPSPEAVEYGFGASARVRAALAPWTVPGFIPTFSYRGADQQEACGERARRARIVSEIDPAGRFSRRGASLTGAGLAHLA